MSLTARPSVAIIGGGVAGVTAAAILAKHKISPTIFEKSRGLGGRLATRRTEDNIHFDHGAQYFTIRDPEFKAFLLENSVEPYVEPWLPRCSEHVAPDVRLIGVPSMNTWLKESAATLKVESQATVIAVTEAGAGCHIRYATPETKIEQDFDYTIITAPPPQIVPIIGANHVLASPLKSVAMAPSWTIMLVVDQSQADFDALSSETSSIAWLARNQSKPQRASSPQTWVAQASANWSAENLETSGDIVLDALMPKILQTIGASAKDVTYSTAHRWRYAKVTEAVGQPCVSSPESRIILAGDWCLGPRVECAFQSGLAAAKHIQARINNTEVAY